jgi:Tol biopolymer transport system component
MRTKGLVIGLVGFVFVGLIISLNGQSQKKEQGQRFEIIEIGNGGGARWSPDGTKIAFSAGGWVCVADVDGREEIRKVGKIKRNSLEWMDDSALVYSEREPFALKEKGRVVIFRIKTIDLKGNMQLVREDTVFSRLVYESYISTPLVLKDGTIGYYEIEERPDEETRIFRIIKEGSLPEEAAVKQMLLTEEGLESIDGTIKKRINYDSKVNSPRLSPDGTKILAHLYYRAGIAIFDTSGKTIADLSSQLIEAESGELGNIESAGWSPDSRKIVYDLRVEDKDTTYSREIYITDFDGMGRVKITDIPGELLGAPGWSPDGTKVVCQSESGKLFVIKLNEK